MKGQGTDPKYQTMLELLILSYDNGDKIFQETRVSMKLCGPSLLPKPWSQEQKETFMVLSFSNIFCCPYESSSLGIGRNLNHS
jgi:hypothetical protein